MNTNAPPLGNGPSPAAKPAPLSLKLSPASRQRLRELAELKRRPAHALAREAVEAYIEQEEALLRRNQEADAAWTHYQDTGLHVPGDEAIAWIKSWGTASEQPTPVCRA
jgi:predicted transcriptional regulator